MNIPNVAKNTALVVLFSAISITSCRQDSEVAVTPQVSTNANKSARLSCTTKLASIGSYTRGSVPMLPPVSSGGAELNSGGDCDYFVGFANNAYPRVVVATLDDQEVAQKIRSLISDAPTYFPGTNQVIGGGFGGSLAKSIRLFSQDPQDTRLYVVLGETRSNIYLSGLASARAMTVRSLLAKHLRLGNP